MSYVISVDRLKNRLDNNLSNTLLIDVRFELSDQDAGQKAYLLSHISGAVYLDLEKDLSDKAAKHGGSHPLPDKDMFIEKIGNVGVDHDTTVVIYDQNNDMFAPRLWWMLHDLGHEHVYVLDGGYDAWEQAGYQTTRDIPDLDPKTFTPKQREDGTVDVEDVRSQIDGDDVVLIDSRSHERYIGKSEPLYSKAGHIPGATNYFWKEVFAETGLWKSAAELRHHFGDISQDAEVIVSCGSGVSACPNVLALKSAGYTNVKLYPGSFSDWISYDENTVQKGEE